MEAPTQLQAMQAEVMRLRKELQLCQQEMDLHKKLFARWRSRCVQVEREYSRYRAEVGAKGGP